MGIFLFVLTVNILKPRNPEGRIINPNLKIGPVSTLRCFVIRNKIEECEVYLHWINTNLHSYWRITSYIANINISINKTHARVNLIGLQGYRIIYGNWLFAALVGKQRGTNPYELQ